MLNVKVLGADSLLEARACCWRLGLTAGGLSVAGLTTGGLPGAGGNAIVVLFTKWTLATQTVD